MRDFLKVSCASPCDSAVLLDLVHALPHDHVLAEVDPRQRALRLHLPEVIPIVQALERGGRGVQQQVTAKVEKASFAGLALSKFHPSVGVRATQARPSLAPGPLDQLI